MKNLLHSLALLSILLCWNAAQADNRTWDGGAADDNFSSPANWDGDLTAPADGDDVTIGSTTVILDVTRSLASLTINGVVTLKPDIDGRTLTTSAFTVNNGATLHIGETDNAKKLIVEISGTGQVGTGSAATLWIYSAGSALIPADNTTLRTTGAGTLAINAGVHLYNAAVLSGTLTCAGEYHHRYAGATYGYPIPAFGSWTGACSMEGNPEYLLTALGTGNGGLNQAFKTFSWNPGTLQTADFNLDLFGTTTGSLSFLGTNTRKVYLASGARSGTLSLGSLSIQNGSQVITNSSGNNITVNISGAVSISGTPASTLVVSQGSGTTTFNVTGAFSASGNSIVRFLDLASTSGDATISVKGAVTSSAGKLQLNNSALGTASLVYSGVSTQVVSSFLEINTKIRIVNNNTASDEAISFTDYPAGCPFIINQATKTTVSGTAVFGNITNTAGISASIEFIGADGTPQTPTFGTITGPFTIVNTNSDGFTGGLDFVDFPIGCNLYFLENTPVTVNGATPVFNDISKDASATGQLEFNGTSAQAVTIAGTIGDGVKIRVNNDVSVSFTKNGSTGIVIPASGFLYIKKGTVPTTGGAIASYDPTATLYYEAASAYTAGGEVPSTLGNVSIYTPGSVDFRNTPTGSKSMNVFTISTVTTGINAVTYFDDDITAASLTFVGTRKNIIDLGTYPSWNTIHVTGSLTLNLGTNLSFVKGKFRQTVTGTNTYVFPVGITARNEATVSFTGASTGHITGEFIPNQPGFNNPGHSFASDGETVGNAIDAYWKIENTGGITFTQYNMLTNASRMALPGTFDNYFLSKRANSAANWETFLTHPGSGANSFSNYALPNQTSFSEFSLLYNPAVFPIELASFTAAEDGNTNVLNWATASEQNTHYFAVERSATGTDNWNEIGQIQATGNSTTLQSYQFTDASPLVESHYRLRAVDFDGTFSVSETRTVSRELGATTVTLAPVPVRDVLHLTINSPETAQCIIRVASVIGGEVVLENTVQMGLSKVEQLDLSNLAAGSYIVSVIVPQTGAYIHRIITKQ